MWVLINREEKFFGANGWVDKLEDASPLDRQAVQHLMRTRPGTSGVWIKSDEATISPARVVSERILVVDHEIARAEVICRLLSEAGYEVAMEKSSSLAIKKAEEFKPKLLIIDPVRPEELGLDTGKHIARQLGCKVLLISAAASERFFADYADEFRHEGVDCDTFPLPFEKEWLLIQIRNQMSRQPH
jgi:CheY-like chemotaxis protein